MPPYRFWTFLAWLFLGLFPLSAADQAVGEQYAGKLREVFKFQDRISDLHPVFRKVYPIAIVEDGSFFVFVPDPAHKEYRLVQVAPDTMNIPKGIRAAMPLGFWGNRMACVVTGEIFDEPAGYTILFHEFVHCAQWESCESKIKETLSVYREAMKKQDFMWELEFPFPYTRGDIEIWYGKFLEEDIWRDPAEVCALRKALKAALAPHEWEYLVWQEWKEGMARYFENLIRKKTGLQENQGGNSRPLTRVSFYRGGERLVRFLEQQKPGLQVRWEELFAAIAVPESPCANR